MSHSNPQLRPDSEAAEAYQQAYASAMRLLARREHSQFELRHKLIVRNFAEDMVDAVLVDLAGVGYLSDERFAELYIRSRFERGIGPRRIQAELRERGIPDSLMDDALQALSESWVESASLQRVRRFGEAPPTDFQSRAKQMRFLQQRGFTTDQIQAVFRN